MADVLKLDILTRWIKSNFIINIMLSMIRIFP